MGPKVEAARAFVSGGAGRFAGIGKLADAVAILEGTAGTIVVSETAGAT
jgi:carbamate kinase